MVMITPFFSKDIGSPDEFEVAMPSGVICLRPSAWSGSDGFEPIIDVKIIDEANGEMAFLLSSEQADELIDALRRVIDEADEAARESEGVFDEVDDPGEGDEG